MDEGTFLGIAYTGRFGCFRGALIWESFSQRVGRRILGFSELHRFLFPIHFRLILFYFCLVLGYGVCFCFGCCSAYTYWYKILWWVLLWNLFSREDALGGRCF